MFESFLASQNEIWAEFARELGGDFSTSFWSGAKVTAKHGPWTVVLDSYTQDRMLYTRLQATYISTDGLQFHIFRKHLFSSIAKLFGLQDIEIGDADFDDAFIVRSNHPEMIKKYFADDKLRFLMMCGGEFQLQTISDSELTVTNHPLALTLRVPELLKDLHELKNYYELFGQALDQLCKIGSVRAQG